MFRNFLLGAAALFAATAATPARADLVAVPIEAQLFAGGPMRAIFVYFEARNRSILRWDQPGGSPPSPLFTNRDPGATPLGTTTGFFGAAGPVDFSLRNTATGQTFTTGVAGPSGIFYARASEDFADFDVGPMPAVSAAAIAALGGIGPADLFIGFEDRACTGPLRPDDTCAGSDLDFNDLIYWFRPLRLAGDPAGVPLPAALALFGAGLLGLGALARRRA